MNNFLARHFPMLFNIVGFQAVWLLCVSGASRSTIIPGLVAALAFALVVNYFSKDRSRDLRTLLLALPIGFMMDSVLAKSKLITFSHALPSGDWAPLWIMCLWLGFAFTLNHSLKSLYAKPLRILLFGFFGAPLAYSIAAYKFNAMSFNGNIVTALLAIAFVWGFGLMMLHYMNKWLLPAKREASLA